MAADDSPFPKDETTPPVMKINLLIVQTTDGIGKKERGLPKTSPYFSISFQPSQTSRI
jgi:hypothetical protein